MLMRGGYAVIQRYGAVWTGDAQSGWRSPRQTPATLMGLGLSGVAFAGSDIGGYDTDNRHGFGAAHPDRSDSVAMWNDACP